VKTTDTETAARELAPFLSPHGIVVSMQNGVDNAERIRTASGMKALPAAVYVAASVPEPAGSSTSAAAIWSLARRASGRKEWLTFSSARGSLAAFRRMWKANSGPN